MSEEAFHVFRITGFSLELCTKNITQIKNFTPGTQHVGFWGLEEKIVFFFSSGHN